MENCLKLCISKTLKKIFVGHLVGYENFSLKMIFLQNFDVIAVLFCSLWYFQFHYLSLSCYFLFYLSLEAFGIFSVLLIIQVRV